MKKKDIVLLIVIAILAFATAELWKAIIPIKIIAGILHFGCRIVGISILSFLLYMGLNKGR